LESLERGIKGGLQPFELYQFSLDLSSYPIVHTFDKPFSEMSKVVLITGTRSPPIHEIGIDGELNTFTGANQGIGYELVKLLAANPEVQKVYLGARNPKSGQEALYVSNKPHRYPKC
jgi:hypothetical protein